MSARNRASDTIADLSRDTGFEGATIHIDPTKWSTRRRNIVLRALNDGLTACGHQTAYFIQCLTSAYGASVETISRWNSSFTTTCVREEEVDNLIAYTCAWIRMDDNPTWHDQQWLEMLPRHQADGHYPHTIPAPRLSPTEQVKFIKQYLKNDDEAKDHRQSLARKIENGEPLTLHVQAVPAR